VFPVEDQLGGRVGTIIADSAHPLLPLPTLQSIDAFALRRAFGYVEPPMF
jgi:hypothetical protein